MIDYSHPVSAMLTGCFILGRATMIGKPVFPLYGVFILLNVFAG